MTDYPQTLLLNEVLERKYLFDCKLSRLKMNPVLRLNCLIEEDGKLVPHYTDLD